MFTAAFHTSIERLVTNKSSPKFFMIFKVHSKFLRDAQLRGHRSRTCAYQGVRNVRFTENLA